jgi:hypothetical protein
MGSIRSSAKWNDFILGYGAQVALELLALNVITISIFLGHNSCSCRLDENKLVRKATSGYLLIFRKVIKYGTKFTILHCLHFLTVNTYGLFIALYWPFFSDSFFACSKNQSTAVFTPSSKPTIGAYPNLFFAFPIS